jgi:hypothetical protein
MLICYFVTRHIICIALIKTIILFDYLEVFFEVFFEVLIYFK